MVSAEGVGTYLMDTVNHAWEEVGRWLLRFNGKVEYVPELNLWFGLTVNGMLAAADLSTVSTTNSNPRLMGKWKEFNPPEEWQEAQEPQLCQPGLRQVLHCKIFGDF